MSAFFFFFFQAEDGIRDVAVTGVQTCALPISHRRDRTARPHPHPARAVLQGWARQGSDRAGAREEAARQARGPAAPRGGTRAGTRVPGQAPVILSLACLLLPAQTVLITTPRGQWAVPVALERGAAAVAAPLLVRPLGLTVTVDVGGSRATVQLGGAVFVFHLGAPFARAGGAICMLVGDPYIARDTLFLPLPWLSDCVPRVLAARD